MLVSQGMEPLGPVLVLTHACCESLKSFFVWFTNYGGALINFLSPCGDDSCVFCGRQARMAPRGHLEEYLSVDHVGLGLYAVSGFMRGLVGGCC
jgi:hypothetical protein